MASTTGGWGASMPGCSRPDMDGWGRVLPFAPRVASTWGQVLNAWGQVLPFASLAVGSRDAALACRQQCRVPARRPGNFHLRAQMKVTKAKGLEVKHPSFLSGASEDRPGGRLFTSVPARTFTSPTTSGSLRFALGGAYEGEAQRARNVGRSTAPRCRCGERPPAGPMLRSEPVDSCGVAFQALCFGDFHLGQQMKVTRPPGRDPACRRHANAASREQADRCEYERRHAIATAPPA